MTTSIPPARRGFRFRLLTIFILVGVVAVALAAWFYYRPLNLTFDDRIAIVDAAAAKAALAAHAPQSVDGSPAVWIVLNDAELNALLVHDGKPTGFAAGSFPQPVSNWPIGASIARTYIQPRQFPLSNVPSMKGTLYAAGGFTGFMGCRLENRVPQVRLMGDFQCTEPIGSTFETTTRIKIDKAKIFYEGEVPRGHLVFLVPVGDDVYHIVVFDSK